MGTIEFSRSAARIEDVAKAARLMFDLDPDERLDFEAGRMTELVKSASSNALAGWGRADQSPAGL